MFMMDCTCKTNRFGMPLLNIVGITSTFKTFNAGFAFMSTEKEEEFQWALEVIGSIVEPKLLITDQEFALMNAINRVFPNCIHLPCIWHISTNIFTTQGQINGTLRKDSKTFYVRLEFSSLFWETI